MSKKEFSNWCLKHFRKINMRFVIEQDNEDDSWEEISKRGQVQPGDSIKSDSDDLKDLKSVRNTNSAREIMRLD